MMTQLPALPVYHSTSHVYASLSSSSLAWSIDTESSIVPEQSAKQSISIENQARLPTPPIDNEIPDKPKPPPRQNIKRVEQGKRLAELMSQRRASGQVKKPIFKSKRAATLFPVSQLIHRLKKSCLNKIVRIDAGVFLAGVLEYLVSEVLDLAGEVAREKKRQTITPQHIAMAVKTDTELDQALRGVIVKQGGVLPHIHPELVKSKPRLVKRVIKTRDDLSDTASLSQDDQEVIDNNLDQIQLAEEEEPMDAGQKKRSESKQTPAPSQKSDKQTSKKAEKRKSSGQGSSEYDQGDESSDDEPERNRRKLSREHEQEVEETVQENDEEDENEPRTSVKSTPVKSTKQQDDSDLIHRFHQHLGRSKGKFSLEEYFSESEVEIIHEYLNKIRPTKRPAKRKGRRRPPLTPHGQIFESFNKQEQAMIRQFFSEIGHKGGKKSSRGVEDEEAKKVHKGYLKEKEQQHDVVHRFLSMINKEKQLTERKETASQGTPISRQPSVLNNLINKATPLVSYINPISPKYSLIYCHLPADTQSVSYFYQEEETRKNDTDDNLNFGSDQDLTKETKRQETKSKTKLLKRES